MTIEQRLQNMENRLSSLQESLIQMQKNQTLTTTKADNTSAQVNVITPITFIEKAYIDDTQVVFTDVPAGNMMVYFDKPYVINRENDRVTITFDPLEEPATITISIL